MELIRVPTKRNKIGVSNYIPNICDKKTRIYIEKLSINNLKEFQAETIRINIDSFPLIFHKTNCFFQKEKIIIHVKKIQIPNYIIIQRFDQDLPIEFIFHKLHNTISIRIPEIRIFKFPSMKTFQTWKHSFSNLFSNDNSDSKLPVIHISSFFIRHWKRKWFRCISPISIGSKYKSIWEIWEHILRAISRI